MNKAPVWLHLDRLLPYRDVRKLVWRHLDAVDRMAVAFAHGCYEPSLKATAACAAEGRVDLLRLAYQRGCRLAFKEGGVIMMAARAGNTEVMDFIAQHRHVLSELDAVLIEGCTGGSMNTIQWAQARGGVLLSEHVALASENNHIHLLRNMRDLWDHFTTVYAGSLDTLMWLRAEGCPWDARTIVYAAGKNKDIFLWALRNGCPFYDVATDVIRAGWVDAFECFHEMGIPIALGQCMCQAVSYRQKGIIDWLLAHGATWPSLAHRIQGVDDDMLAWMRARGYPN